eukprot:scaffold15778_cov58-Skeletonema_marinoi.AAC.1
MESFVYDIWVPADSFFASPFFVSVLIFAWIPWAVIPHASSPNKTKLQAGFHRDRCLFGLVGVDGWCRAW